MYYDRGYSFYEEQQSRRRSARNRRLWNRLLACLLAAAMATAALLALSGCHKGFEWFDVYGDIPLRVTYYWGAVPEDPHPTQMSLAVTAENAYSVLFPSQGRDTVTVLLNAGTYGLVGFSSDREMFGTRGESWGEYSVWLRRTTLNDAHSMFARTRNVPKGEGSEEEPVVYQPDSVWTAAQDGVRVRAGANNRVSLTMRKSWATYRFILREVDSLAITVSALCTLSGMSDAWLPAWQEGTDTEAIIPFRVYKTDETTLEGSVRTFGHCRGRGPGDYHRHLLVLYVEYRNMQKLYYTVDITSQMHDADHLNGGDTEVPIVIGEFPPPIPIVDENDGLQPDVGEWEDVHVPIQT